MLSAGDFWKCGNCRYLDVKCRKRMPQHMGGCVVIGAGCDTVCRGRESHYFSSFSSRRKILGADTSRIATLFPEKNPERPFGACGFFREIA